jgi:hypothetical protein
VLCEPGKSHLRSLWDVDDIEEKNPMPKKKNNGSFSVKTTPRHIFLHEMAKDLYF